MDEWFAAGPELRSRLTASQRRLADPASLTDAPTTGVTAIASGADAAPDPMAHFAEHWLQAGGFFPTLDPDRTEQIIREGFAAAVDDALGADLPMTTVWVRSPGADDFRVDHVVGPTAVAVVIVTPTPEGM